MRILGVKAIELISVAVLVAAGSHAQTVQPNSDIATLRRYVSESPDEMNIRQLGRVGDRSDIQLLRTIRKRLGNPPADRLTDRQTVDAAEMAMARLGDDASFRKVIAELDNRDSFIASQVFSKLVYIRTKDSFRLLYRLLDDDRERSPNGDQVFYPFSFEAMVALGQIVPDPPLWDGRPPVHALYPSSEFVALWKNWFREHPDVLE